jgi:hypothetical protein
MGGSELLRKFGRNFVQPQFLAFAIMFVPVWILGAQMRPAAVEDQVQEYKKRYGYQVGQEAHARNAKAMETIFERRHQHVGEYTAGFQQPKDAKK